MTTSSAVTPDSIVLAARSYLGTPFRHQGRLKRVGVDCVGLLVGVARELGIWGDSIDHTAYRRREDGTILMEMLETHLVIKSLDDPLRPGDILAMRHSVPQHVAIVSEAFPNGEFQIIHALDSGVVEHRLSTRWRRKIVGVFEFPGVAYDREPGA